MRTGITKWAILLLMLALFSESWAGNDFPEFREVSPKGGFTFGSVHQITEDAHGFIWFGSHHGLFRYNTETIDKFVHNPQNPHSIPSNFISTITRDSSGTMWFSTDKGICFYNEHKEYFERCSFYNSNKEPLPANILQIVSSDNNTMWAYGDRMLFLTNTKTMSYERVIVNPTDNYISFIYIDKNKKLWVRSTTGMVYWADPPYLSFTAFGEVLNQPIHSMLFSNNKLWIGYESYGAYCYDIYGKLIGEYSRNRPEGFDIKSDRVRRIFDDGKGRIWMATYNGISVIENGKITHHTDKNTRGLIHPSVYDIYADSKQGIWVSTWAGTLSYAHPYDNVFEHLKSENGLSNNVVSSIVEKNGLVWIGTEGGGLNVYNPASGEISKINLNPDFKDEQNVKTLEFDNNGALWVGTFNDGLWIIKSFDTKGHPLVKSKVLQGNYYHLKKEGPYIWAASYYNGIYQIETTSLKSVNYPGNAANLETIHTNHSRALMIDSKGGLWVGTQSGICYRRKGEKDFERFAHNPNDPTSLNGTQVFYIFEDSNHQIWVGTSSGLNRFNPETKSFYLVDVVPGNEIYGLAEDSKKNLWISSDNGITEYNPQNNRFRNFNMEDGLQGNQFNPGAVFCSSSGKIFFGGPNGLTIFHPDQVKSNPIAPRSVVVGIHINNQLQVPYDTSSVMHESILKANHFKLKHDQNSITFGFVANNFLNPQKNTFRYRLVNYDNQWIEAGTRKTATYTKIPPGQYVFQVIATNNDGFSNEEPTEVHFTVEAPWWKKWYAYTTYMIIVLGSIFFVQREILIRHRLRNEIIVEKIKSQSEQELNQAKLTFFTNISHEIKTPLSLILSPLDFLLEKRKGDKELTDVLKTIQRNGNRLKYLLHQVIDIRRIDAGKLTFSPGNHNVVSIIKELLGCFTIEASEREIDFRFESEFESLSTQIDPDKFDKILFNLLTNAFKFVPDHGEVSVTLLRSNAEKPYIVGSPIQGEYLEIQVFNSGSSIDPAETEAIFDRFYQAKENRKRGTGIGLHMVKEYTQLHKGQIHLTSEPGLGTSFIVRIPLGNADQVDGAVPEKAQQKSEWSLVPDTEDCEEIRTERKQKLVLIVEDNTELRSFLRKTLSGWYAVITAPNGKKGYEQALELNPDLIVSDVMMPEMNGFEMCRRIKEDINTSHIPVILLTALSSEENQIEGFRTGADAYVAKPFSEKLLRAQIDNILATRQRIKERFFDPEAVGSGADDSNGELKLIEKAISIVEANLLDPNFTVELLAEKLKLSRTSLHRKLKAHTDQSSTEFIRYVRLKKALKMLKTGNYSIDEVSYAVGFNTPSYFSQSFKRQFGKSPKAYLNQKEE